MRWQILPNGDLKITISESTQAELQHAQAQGDGFESEDAMRAVFEPLIVNDEFEWVDPAWIGALTDAPILGTFDESREVTDEAPGYYRFAGRWHNAAGKLVTWMDPVRDAWWYPDYALRSPQEDLAETRRVVFKRVQFESEEG